MKTEETRNSHKRDEFLLGRITWPLQAFVEFLVVFCPFAHLKKSFFEDFVRYSTGIVLNVPSAISVDFVVRPS